MQLGGQFQHFFKALPRQERGNAASWKPKSPTATAITHTLVEQKFALKLFIELSAG